MVAALQRNSLGFCAVVYDYMVSTIFEKVVKRKSLHRAINLVASKMANLCPIFLFAPF